MYSRSWPLLNAEGSVGYPSFTAAPGVWNEAQREAAERIEATLEDIDVVRLVFCDPHGLARSKTLTTAAFRAVLSNGMNFSPGPYLLDTGHAPAIDLDDPGIGVEEITGAANVVLVPDPLTFLQLPGQAVRTAWVLGDEYLRNGKPHPLSSRAVLRRVLHSYAEARLTPVIGLELEWYLTRRLPGPAGNKGNGLGTQGRAPRVAAVNAGYQFNGDTAYSTVSAVTDPLALQLCELGLPLRTMEHEMGPGQIETTFGPMSALDAADATLLMRTYTKQWCAQLDHHASFMSLPRIDGADPSGWHLNQSVRDDATGRNLLCGEGATGGMSPAAKGYAEGLMATARDLCLLSVPTVNGYRRFSEEHALSPTRIGWSLEDRTVMLRISGTGPAARIENRIGEPCANPYLTIAAQLYAGLDGMDGAPRAADGQGTGTRPDGPDDTVPRSLRESLDAFRAGRAAEVLGAPLHACLTKLKESELSRFEAWCAVHRPGSGTTTKWEQREYFDMY